MDCVWSHLPVYAYDHHYRGTYPQRYLPENIARFGYYCLQGYMIYCLMVPVDHSNYSAGGQTMFYQYHHDQIEQPEQTQQEEEEENDDNVHDDNEGDGEDVDVDNDDDYGSWEELSVETLDEDDDDNDEDDEVMMWDIGHEDDPDHVLSEEKIAKCLKIRCPKSEEDEICVVCQEGLLHGDDDHKIATLDCGHEYHAGCIKNWLTYKNCCPLCKATAITSLSKSD